MKDKSLLLHKECLLLLKALYAKALLKQPLQKELTAYLKKSRQLQLPSLKPGFKEFSQRHYFHLRQLKPSIKENDLLPYWRQIHRRTKISLQAKKLSRQPAAFGQAAIYLEEIYSAYNVANIIRTVEAFRLGAVYFSPEAPPLEKSRIAKSSFGALESVKLFYGRDLKTLPRPWIALDTFQNKTVLNLFAFAFPQTFTLILGNEERGISQAALKKADLFLTIPLCGNQKALNVASAFAIAAGQIRQSRSFG
ncbi:MAG: TrmH family RNA methyltransferase [Parachlamydiales bacterium]